MTSRLVARLAGVAAASGLALTGLVVAASPASAAACSGTSGVTVVVDRGGSVSTRCASGDPATALGALKAAGFSVEYPQQFPGSVVCRINGYPSSDPCVRMPPSSAYWAFFHAKRGGSWVYSSSGVASYNPAPGSVVGFRFGSGQQPGIAPPAPTRTSAPTPTKTTPKPRPTSKPAPKPAPTTSKPKATTSKPRPTTRATTSKPTIAARGAAPTATSKGQVAGSPSARPSATAKASASASASATSSSPSASGTSAATPSETASDIAAAPTSADANDNGSGPGSLLAGGALVALVAGGAGFAAWRRRS